MPDPATGPPFSSAADHPHALDCRCAKCEADRHPPFGIGPPFTSPHYERCASIETCPVAWAFVEWQPHYHFVGSPTHAAETV